MKLNSTGFSLLALLIVCSLGTLAQDIPSSAPAKAPDKAAAYYHFAMAHIY